MITQQEYNLLDKVSLKQSPMEHMTGFELVRFYHALRQMVITYPQSEVVSNELAKSGVRLVENLVSDNCACGCEPHQSNRYGKCP